MICFFWARMGVLLGALGCMTCGRPAPQPAHDSKTEEIRASTGSDAPRHPSGGPGVLDINRPESLHPWAFAVDPSSLGTTGDPVPSAGLDTLQLPLARNILADFDGDRGCDGLGYQEGTAGESNLIVSHYTITSLPSAFPIFIPDGGSAAGVVSPEYWVFGPRLASADLNDDGFSDLAVGNPGFDEFGEPNGDSGKVIFFPGAGRERFSNQAGATYAGGPAFGSIVKAIGDFDGDGRPDMAVSDPGFLGGAGRVYVLLEDPMRNWKSFDALKPGKGILVLDGDSTLVTRDWEDSYPMDGMHYGSTLASAGDFNGDGKEDLLVGYAGLDRRGVALEFGRAEGSLSRHGRIAFEAPVPGGDAWILPAQGGFDFDGDAYADFVLGGSEAFGGHGGVAMIRGGLHFQNWPPSIPYEKLESLHGVTIWMQPQNADHFGTALAPPVDLDGDNRSELVVFGSRNGRDAAWVAYGSRLAGYAAGDLNTLGAASPDPRAGFLISLHPGIGRPPATAVCDISGDGLEDLLIGLAGKDFVEFRLDGVLGVLGWE